MPTNKNAQLRYIVIEREILKARLTAPTRLITVKHLQKACADALAEYHPESGVAEVSESTIKHDILDMRRILKHDIAFKNRVDGSKGSYYYRTPPNNLEPQLTEQIRLLLKQLEPFRGLQYISDLVLTLIKKTEQRLQIDTAGISAETIVHFEQVPYQGGRHLNDLVEARIKRHPVYFCYKPFYQDKERDVRLHPYLIKEYNNRYYVFGWDEDKQGIRNFAVDRIVSDIKGIGEVEILEHEPFQEMPHQLERLEDIIGVTLREDAELTTVLFRVSKGWVPYMETLPLHKSQQVVARGEDESVTFSIQVYPNPELQTTLLRYGESLTVLSPEWLVDSMRERVERMMGNYRANNS